MSFFANWGSLAAPAHLFLPKCLPSSYSSLFVRRPTDHLAQEQLLGKIQVTQDGTSSCLVLEFVPYRVYCIHKHTLSLSAGLTPSGGHSCHGDNGIFADSAATSAISELR